MFVIFKYFSIFLICFLNNLSASGHCCEFDLEGKLTKVTTADNCHISYDYDELHQLNKVIDSQGKVFSFQYDANGNCISAENEHGITKYEYDGLNKLTSVSYPGLHTLNYSYDHRGRLQQIAYGGEISIVYSYDASNHLISVLSSQGKTKYIYNYASNTLLKTILPNGIITEFEYDKAKRITSIFHRQSDTTLIVGYRYTFDGNSNRIRTEEIKKNKTRIINYSYDRLNRLVMVEYPEGYEKYTYDELGNRLTKETQLESISYEYDQNNRLIKAGEKHFFYDSRGNLVKKTAGKKTTEYIYDVHDNLIEFQDGFYKILYSYDPQGRRISKTINGEKIFYLNDIHSPVTQVLAELRADKTIKTAYTYGLSRLSQSSNQNAHFYLYDYPDRNVTALVDANQQLCNFYDYEAFGLLKSSNSLAPNNFTYAGEANEEETGLIFLRNRYYDPEIGRFITPDIRLGKLINPQSLNPYTYVENNPVNFIDPMGLESACFCAYNPGTVTENGKSATGHGFWIFKKDNGNVLSLGRYPGGPAVTDKIVPGTVSFTLPATDNQINAIIARVSKGRYLGVAGNCIDGLEWGLDILGVEHPSFNFLGISLPTKAVLWIESLNGKDDFKQAMEQDLKFIANPDLFFPAVRPAPTVVKPECPSCAKPSGDFGGVSFDKAAQAIGSFKDIIGATYDSSTGQLILIGTQNYSLPSMDFDDLAVAVRSIYGLGGKPAQSPGVSIEWNPENNKKLEKGKLTHLHHMPVRYEGATEGTRFGQIMFEADRVLKCLTLGIDNVTERSFKANVPGYQSLLERYSNQRKELLLDVTSQIWFSPKEVILVKSPDGKSIIFDSMQMEASLRSFQQGEPKKNSVGEAFANHITAHFDEFAKQYPIFEEMKRLGKITSIVKWIKENNIPMDLSLFSNYIPKNVPTASSTPATVVYYAFGPASFPVIGGIAYHLHESNFHEIMGDIPYSMQENVLRSRPSENVMEWDLDRFIGNGLKAVAQTIEHTRKIGNVQKIFIDMYFPVSKGFSLELIRYYNSFNERSSGFGKGWEVSPAMLQFPRTKIKIEWKDKNITKELFKEIFAFEKGKEFHYLFKGLNNNALAVYQSENSPTILLEQENGTFILLHEHDTLLFDPAGKLLQKIDGEGQSIWFSYDSDKLTSITHQNGNKIQFEYQNGQIIHAYGPGGKTIYYQYDENGQLSSVADPEGTIAFYGYDSEKNLNAIYDAKKHPIFEASYDTYHRAISITKGKIGSRRQFSLKNKTVHIQGSNQVEVFNQYDPNYRLLQTKDSLGRSVEISYQNGALQPSFIRDSFGNESFYAYDNRGNLSSIKNKSGVEWKFWYDTLDRLIASQDGKGRAEIYQYDGKGRLNKFFPYCSIRDENLTTGQLSCQYTQTECLEYEYDHAGAVTAIKKGNELVNRFSYDSSGMIASISDRYGYTIQKRYDERSRLKAYSDGEWGFKYTYNERDLVTKISSSVGCTNYDYDEIGNLIRIMDANGNETHLEYDENYNLIAVTDAEGKTTRYIYNDLCLLTEIILPNRSSKEIVYDSLYRPQREIVKN